MEVQWSTNGSQWEKSHERKECIMLNGKTAVITGSTRGIGLSIAIKFLENGANVVICGSKQESVDKALCKLKECFPAQKLMGICLGMQMLFEKSFEYGAHMGLGLIKGYVGPLEGQISKELKIPHMGWNSLQISQPEGIFRNFKGGEFVYFVHSFYVPVSEHTAAATDYIHPFSAAMHKDNFYATQFHPEKSGEVGQQILRNFLEL